MKRTFKVTQKIDASADLSTDWISISQRQLLKSPNIHFIFIMRPTFIAVVGTDGEDSKSNIGVLVHIHLIRCLCKCRLVIIYVTDKNTDIRGVWNNTNTDKKKNEIPRQTKNIVTINIFRYLYSNLITFCQLVHAQRNIKNIFFFFSYLWCIFTVSACVIVKAGWFFFSFSLQLQAEVENKVPRGHK